MYSRVAAFAVVALVFVAPAASGEDGAASSGPAATATAAAMPATAEPETVAAMDEASAKKEDPAGGAAKDNAGDHPLAQIAAIGPDAPRAVAPGAMTPTAMMPTAMTPSNMSPVAVPPVAPTILAEPFGRAAVEVDTGDVVTKWNGVEAQIRAEHDVLAHCRDDMASCPVAAQRFLAIVAEGRAHSGRARIGIINRAINLAIRPMSDLAQWGVVDRWSSPLDTLTTGRGDCEDYAIAKYVALKEAGVAAEDVRLVILRNIAVGEDHAAVAVRLDGIWLLLDNRWLTLVEADAMPGVVPLFVLDGGGVRRFGSGPLPVASRGAAPAGKQGEGPIYLDAAS